MMAISMIALCALAVACDEPVVQSDTSGLGDSPIAVQAYANSSSGTEEGVERHLSRWFQEQCPFDRADDLCECVTALGMICDNSAQLVCRYRGVLRSRMVNRRSPPDYEPRDTPWRSGAISIEVQLLAGEPPVVDFEIALLTDSEERR